MEQLDFFDTYFRLEKSSQMGDSLKKLDKIIDREIFRPIISEALAKTAKGSGGASCL